MRDIELQRHLSSSRLPRRDLLARAGAGFGLLGLAGMLADDRAGAAQPAPIDLAAHPLAPRLGHFPPRAKNVIWLFINGGPSHVDTFDYKPELEKRDGQPLPGFDKNTGFFADQVGGLMKSPFEFRRHGESGAWVSSLFPHLARHVDKMAFIKSCWTDSNNHAPALLKINTGMARMGFPCTGSWVTYGLGSENRDLPGFVVMYDTKGRGLPKGYAQNWSAGFLPGVFQGTGIDTAGTPIPNLSRLQGMSDAAQRAQFDLAAALNGRHLDGSGADSALQARIESYELAYRMQMEATDALDVSGETKETLDLYKADTVHGRQLLIARRLVERGVRVVQCYHGDVQPWDSHSNIAGEHRRLGGEADGPIAALLTDLHRRGLLEETLVICGGEFGRTPAVEIPIGGGEPTGRDHNHHGFSVWLAGGGVQGGLAYGATDEFGYRAVEHPVHVHDLHATLLHLLGLDHTRLTYRHAGRDFRLTDVAGRVAKGILA